MTRTEHELRLLNMANKISAIGAHVHHKIADLQEIRYFQGDCPDAESLNYDDSTWRSFHIGQSWGGRDKTCWFRMPFRAPDVPAGHRLSALIQPGKKFAFISSEGGDLREYEVLVYLDGRPLQSVDVRRNTIPLWDKVRPGENHLLALQAFSGLESHKHTFLQAELVATNSEAEDFYYYARNALETLQLLKKGTPAYSELFRLLYDSLLKIDFLREGQPAFYQSIARANAFLKNGLRSIQSGKEPATIVCTGHSHLDIAWKWRTRHSVHKMARTTANALRQMDLYPDFRFMQSQAQLYRYLQDCHPELFSRVKEKIAAGRWEATGGMWVESDCNLPGGESLVRQFLYGLDYFENELGVTPKVVWLPDTFGFCASLPQIIRKSGMKYFSTTKLSWNQFTEFPHDTFWWQGPDGSRILVHMVTTPDRRGWNDYSVDLNPANVLGCWNNYRQKEQNSHLLLTFGWGDGGGGPTTDMQENAKRMKELPCLPNFYQGSVEAYFEELETKARDLPVWADELYLQLHRGCYTSQAAAKRHNRKSEVLLHDAEFFSALSFLSGHSYPHRELRNAWELLLLNQFHDILPGSSIAEVYRDSEKEFEQINKIGKGAVESAFAKILDSPKTRRVYTVFNTISWERKGVVSVPIKTRYENLYVEDSRGNPLLFQIDSQNKHLLVETREIPSYGWDSITVKKGRHKKASTLKVSETSLENDFFIIRLNEKANIISLFDKRFNKEFIPKGKQANQLQAFEDRPISNNAWDIDFFYQDKISLMDDVREISVLESGPVRGMLLVERKFLESTIRQRIIIYRSIPRIDFDTEIDWQQHQILLKVAFPVNIKADHATFEIPYGVIGRPTKPKTRSDKARFEVPAQKWADLSDGRHGIGLLNDCKYGYDVIGNTLRLSLLRSPIDPDPNADIGHHRFCYSLLPHSGDWLEGEIQKHAEVLNMPLRLARGQLKPMVQNNVNYFVRTDNKNVVIEAIKRAENEEALIFRLRNIVNEAADCTITFCFAPQQIYECNLVEKKKGAIGASGKVNILLDPFELKTLIVIF